MERRCCFIEKTAWRDKNGSCKCESCGKTVPENKLKWDKGMGYCDKCYTEIKKYRNKDN